MRKWKRDLLRLRQKIKQERNRINMTSQTLREARKYEEASEKMIKQEERPDFHLSVRTGWMNDRLDLTALSFLILIINPKR